MSGLPLSPLVHACPSQVVPGGLDLQAEAARGQTLVVLITSQSPLSDTAVAMATAVSVTAAPPSITPSSSDTNISLSYQRMYVFIRCKVSSAGTPACLKLPTDVTLLSNYGPGNT
jgi:hypothetical protein